MGFETDKHKAELSKRVEFLEAQLSQVQNRSDMFTTMMDALSDAVFMLTLEGEVMYVNKGGEKLFSQIARKTDSKFLSDLLPSERIEAYDEIVKGVIGTKKKVKTVRKVVVDGIDRWFNVLLVPKFDEQKNITAVLGMISEITQDLREEEEAEAARKQTQDELEYERTKLSVALSSIGEAVITTDTDGIIVSMNKVAEELTQTNELKVLGKPIESVYRTKSERTKRELKTPIATLKSKPHSINSSIHKILVGARGEETLITDTCAAIRKNDGEQFGAVLAFRDVSKQRLLEDEMHRVEKMDSIGLMAGGIAHDFNNIFTVAMGNLSIAFRRLGDTEKLTVRLKDAKNAIEKARALANQLLVFSKGGEPDKKVTSIKELVIESAEFALSGSASSCEFSFPDELYSVEVDAGQIGQVIQNLVINAVQSMPDGGKIDIICQNVAVEDFSVSSLHPGNYVKFSLRDRGVGIEEEKRSRIFDPYYTTKTTGTGLGLATAHSIIRRHGGHIACESQVGVGTVFHVYLPSVDSKVEMVLDSVYPDFTGTGWVLLMEDNPTIGQVTSEMLKEVGFQVVYVAEGDSAEREYLEWYKKGNRFDAVIMDLTIPGGVGGKEAVKRILKIDPKARVIAASGFSNDPVLKEYEKYGFSDMLTKPYGIEQLLNVLRKTIGSTPPPPKDV